MSRTTITTAHARIARLIPTDGAPLQGQGVYVLTAPATLPHELQGAQRRRVAHYLSTGDRSGPADAPRYVVTYNGTLLAWVTMDGATHYAGAVTPPGQPLGPGLPFTTNRELTLLLKHRHAVAVAWPDAFPVAEHY